MIRIPEEVLLRAQDAANYDEVGQEETQAIAQIIARWAIEEAVSKIQYMLSVEINNECAAHNDGEDSTIYQYTTLRITEALTAIRAIGRKP